MMIGSHLDITQVALVLSIIIRLIVAVLFLTLIIPLQLKEVGVKNGLKTLRYELLVVGIIVFMINTVGLLLVTAKFFVSAPVVNTLTNILTILNSLGFLAIGIAQYNIYHRSYTPEQKKLHEKFGKIEVAAEKKRLTEQSRT